MINELSLTNFMGFTKLEIKFSQNINIISGENSTGKTAVLKVLYSTLKALSDAGKGNSDFIKEAFEFALVKKLQGVFRPDDDFIGRLVNRMQVNKRAEVSIHFRDGNKIEYGFGSRNGKHIDIYSKPQIYDMLPVFLPSKEAISTTSNFGSLYEDYHIDFEETYFDLARLLDKPLKKGPNTDEQKGILTSFEKIINGKVIQVNKRFYIDIKGQGKFEMGLVSEGYRKLSTIIYLILSGSLSKNSILFWDEPEVNMNPKMIRPMMEAVAALAKMGVQVFISTHDYFVQQYFNLIASYPKANKNNLAINFTSLYRNIDDSGKSKIVQESNSDLLSLSKNTIMEEFDELYKRELELM